MSEIQLQTIGSEESAEFLAMAQIYFRELNPAFVARADWTANFFDSILKNDSMSACWILSAGEKAGFVVFGVEPHRYLPRTTGVVYEMFVAPEFRRRQTARQAAVQAIEILKKRGVSKLQLEVVEGNAAAANFWQNLGFTKVAGRFILQD